MQNRHAQGLDFYHSMILWVSFNLTHNVLVFIWIRGIGMNWAFEEYYGRSRCISDEHFALVNSAVLGSNTNKSNLALRVCHGFDWATSLSLLNAEY